MKTTAANTQLMALVRMGLPLEEAARSLGLSPEAAAIAIASENRSLVSDKEKERCNRMKDVLEQIALTSENDSARVAAAKFLVENTKKAPPMEADKVDSILKKMDLIKQSVISGKTIDIKAVEI